MCVCVSDVAGIEQKHICSANRLGMSLRLQIDHCFGAPTQMRLIVAPHMRHRPEEWHFVLRRRHNNSNNNNGTQPPQPQIVIISRHIFSDGWHGFCVRFSFLIHATCAMLWHSACATIESRQSTSSTWKCTRKTDAGCMIRCSASAHGNCSIQKKISS